MSITVSNCNEICNSPTNTSHAKMLYTFSKECRFPNRVRVLYFCGDCRCDKFYDPTKSPGRSTSLGFANKYDFTKDGPKSPSPNTYQIKSEFQNRGKRGTGFGEGREEMAVTGPFFITVKNKNPGPGNYEAISSLNKISYSMLGKSEKEDKEKLKIPGPGTYEESFGLNPKGKYFLAKHKSSYIRNFNHSCKRTGPNVYSITPGPGKYNFEPQQMSAEGKYFLSKMHNSMSRKFGTSLRQPLAQKSSTPGPGNYRLPSEFGYYVAKCTMQNDSEQKENKN